MNRITIPAIETATGSTAEIYAQIKKSVGSIPNLFAVLGHLTPETLKAFLNAENILAQGSLNKQDLQTIRLLVSNLTGCDYCEAAHFMLGKMAGLPVETLRQIRAGEPTGDAKRDALIRFVKMLQQTSGTISQEEFNAIRAAGYTDAQLADISFTYSLILFTNTFNRINDTAVDFPPIN